MRILITCGPSWEPIDQARRITNFSTGRLGAVLCDAFAASGHAVTCLRGEGSTHPAPRHAADLRQFATNDDLIRHLETLAGPGAFDAVLHAAALCDYRVEEVRDDGGSPVRSAKFATRDGRLHLILAPAAKVLPRLRDWFPSARIAGWKYELSGTREDALARAWRQITENRTDACVLNGAAYGQGFAVCEAGGAVRRCVEPAELALLLEGWIESGGPGVRP